MIPALMLAAAYDPDDVKPGWIALVLLVALGVATFLLWRSMNTQLRKIQMAPRVRQRPGFPRSPAHVGQEPRRESATDDRAEGLPSSAQGPPEHSRDDGVT